MPRRSVQPFYTTLPTILIAVVSCTASDHPAARWPEETAPVLSVALAHSMVAVSAVDSVRLVAPSPIGFAATVEPDREHTRPVLVASSGESRLLEVSAASMRHVGDTVALLRQTGNPGSTWAATAVSAGWWRPRRYLGESVWPGDTLGTIQTEGWYRAFGRLEHGGGSPARLGDAATIVLPGAHGTAIPGTVRSVLSGGFGGTDIYVHFLAQSDSVLPPAIVQVTVFPRESLLVVPSGAVVNLSFGPAVFLPRGHGAYAVQFLVVDPHASLGTVVHGGLDGPAAVAAGDLRQLVAAAEESLSVIRRRRD